MTMHWREGEKGQYTGDNELELLELVRKYPRDKFVLKRQNGQAVEHGHGLRILEDIRRGDWVMQMITVRC